MAKTEFEDGKTAVVAEWLNQVFSHVHDGADEDGHVSQIDVEVEIDWGEEFDVEVDGDRLVLRGGTWAPRFLEVREGFIALSDFENGGSYDGRLRFLPSGDDWVLEYEALQAADGYTIFRIKNGGNDVDFEVDDDGNLHVVAPSTTFDGSVACEQLSADQVTAQDVETGQVTSPQVTKAWGVIDAEGLSSDPNGQLHPYEASSGLSGEFDNYGDGEYGLYPGAPSADIGVVAHLNEDLPDWKITTEVGGANEVLVNVYDDTGTPSDARCTITLIWE